MNANRCHAPLYGGTRPDKPRKWDVIHAHLIGSAIEKWPQSPEIRMIGKVMQWLGRVAHAENEEFGSLAPLLLYIVSSMNKILNLH